MGRTAAAFVLSVILAGCVQIGPPATPAANEAPAQGSVASAARITPPPVTPPTPPGSSLPAFQCADARGGTTGVAHVTSVRLAKQAGYDRFVLQFDAKVPTYTVKRQAKPAFTQGASGQSITLSGTAGALVVVSSATQANTYSGPIDISHPEFPVLKEARLTEDFEGRVAWGLGLAYPACMRTFTLTNPARLVVDFKTAPA